MAATAATCFPLSVPIPPPSHKFSPLLPKHFYRCSNPSLVVKQPQISSPPSIRSVSSPETAVVEEQAEQSGTPPDDDVSLDSASLPPLTTREDFHPISSISLLLTGKEMSFVIAFNDPKGCKACGRDDIERGCNGEGRIQGGIATIPGFGWWPIKAYRPCPAYVASGGRYRRIGQSMDEVVSGGAAKSSKKEDVSKRLES